MCRFRADASRLTAIALALTAIAAACRAPSRELDADAHTYVRLAVALGEHDPDSLDFYSGSDDFIREVRRTLPPLTAVRAEAVAAADRVAHIAGSSSNARAMLLSENLRAIAARVDVVRGLRRPYAQEAQALFGIVPPASDPQRLSDLRDEIGRLLPGPEPLTERYATFASRFVVPKDRLEVVVRTALDECRRQTAAHLSLPPGEGVTLEFVTERPWSAYSRYRGHGHSVIQLNTDFAFTLDQVLQLACHEGYPGHHTRNVLRDASTDPASAWPERAVELTFSPEGLVAEASATTAVDVAFEPADRVRIVRDRLAPLAGIGGVDVEKHVAIERLMTRLQEGQAGIASAYLDGRLEFERAVDALQRETLVPHAEALVKYINEYRTYVAAYTSAAHLFRTQLQACTDGRWSCFQSAMMRPTLGADAVR